MKTLGIFGDSYGRSGRYDIAENDWVDFIKDTGKFEVTNFSVGGSSLWYSYKLDLSKLINPKNSLEYYFQTVYTIEEINTNTRKQKGIR